MTPKAIDQLIGRALTERSFREQLLERPGAALREYPLSKSERSHIVSVKAPDLEEFSRLLSERFYDPIDEESTWPMGLTDHAMLRSFIQLGEGWQTKPQS
jgi:hypothetical protein